VELLRGVCKQMLLAAATRGDATAPLPEAGATDARQDER
jgi:hypothetical protein